MLVQYRQTVIDCEHRGKLGQCFETFERANADSFSQHRRDARRAGWRIWKGKTYCPRHAMQSQRKADP